MGPGTDAALQVLGVQAGRARAHNWNDRSEQHRQRPVSVVLFRLSAGSGGSKPGLHDGSLARVIRYAFDELRLHRIEANIMPRNSASLKMVEKLGFSSEGLARKYLKINGIWEDHIHMVLLNEAVE